MSKVDDTFDFANSLVMEWGQDAVFVRKTGSTYDPATGLVSSTETTFNVKAVFLEIEPEDSRIPSPPQADVDNLQVNH